MNRRIEVRIGELVLHGLDHVSTSRVVDATERHLTNLVARHGLAGVERHAGAAVVRAGVADVRSGAGSAEVGRAIARAVYRGLTS